MYAEHRVVKVNPQSVEAICLRTNEKKVFPFGMCVWASGVKPNDISFQLSRQLQPNARMLEVDKNMRALGSNGTVFALGDCSKVVAGSMTESATSLWEKADVDGDGALTQEEFG